MKHPKFNLWCAFCVEVAPTPYLTGEHQTFGPSPSGGGEKNRKLGYAGHDPNNPVSGIVSPLPKGRGARGDG